MATLELYNLKKQFSAKVIPVRNVNLSVEDGEFLSLLGPSGCGKSTLLRLIAGLESPSQGQIKIGNKVMNEVAPGDRNIAMVFQSYALYPHMTAAENIASALKIRKLPTAEINHRIQQAAKQLKLIDKDKNWLDYKPGQLSGGQRQRVALARALVRQPDVFLLDEPLSNLDALLREQVRAELKQIFQQQNRPVVYVTHDQTEAMTLSTKIAVLSDGLIQQLDIPQKIYRYPANQFVAEFVGSPQMNLLPLVCDQNQVILGDFKLNLPQYLPNMSHVILGIRPEDVKVSLDAQDTNLVGKIILIEQLGKENLVTLEIKSSDLTVRLLLPSDFAQNGDFLNFTFPEDKLHWFKWNGDSHQPLDERDRLVSS